MGKKRPKELWMDITHRGTHKKEEMREGKDKQEKTRNKMNRGQRAEK